MDKVKAFIQTIMSAISNCSLYTAEHPSVDEFMKRAFRILNEIIADKGALEMMIIDNDLVVNKEPLKDGGIHAVNFVRRLRRKGITRIDFLQGINLSELKQVVYAISQTEKRLGSLPHVKTGAIDVRLGGIQMEGDEFRSELSQISMEQVQRLKEIYPQSSSPFKPISIAGIEEVVVTFFVTLKREANLLKLVSPVRTYSEYTYTHATNVAVLSMFQAESLGFSDEFIHDIGIAGLLHDVGKLFISKEVLEKKGKLSEKEFEEITRHTLYGATYLAKMDALTPLAAIAAFEHHRRFDGHGYPNVKTGNKRQHICSQIIAISDFFDALRSRRPYKKDWEIREILTLMKKGAGKEFNPMLVKNFARMLLIALRG